MTTPVRPTRRWFVRTGLRLSVLGAAVVLTVVLAEHTTTAAFTTQTGDTGNQVGAAASFCATPGSGWGINTEDTSIFESSQTANTGATGNLTVLSATGGNTRSLIRFTLPPIPSGCSVTTATLSLYAVSSAANRTIDVYRVDPAAPVWAEAGVTWNSRPAPTGAPVGSASLGAAGRQTWTVTPLMAALYAAPSNGFLVQDALEGDATGKSQSYASSENATAANHPTLQVTWG